MPLTAEAQQEANISHTTLTVAEGGTVTFTISPHRDNAFGVVQGTVTITAGSDAISISSPDVRTDDNSFSTSSSITVTVTGLQDNDFDNETATIRVTAFPQVGNDQVHNIAVTVNDDDEPEGSIDIEKNGSSIAGTTVNGREGFPYTFDMVLESDNSGGLSGAGGTVTLTTVPATTTSRYSFDRTAVVRGTAVSGSFTPPLDANTNSSSYVVTATVASTNPLLDGETASFTINAADTDANTGGQISVNRTRLTVNEGGSGSFTIRVDVNHTLAPADGSVAILSGSDASVSVSRTSFDQTLNGADSYTVTVSAAEDDDLMDGTATIRVRDAGGGSEKIIFVTVIDNDEPAGVTVSETELTIDEDSNSSYTIVLNTEPTSNVTITPSSDDTDAATVSDALTFTQANWNTAQSVTVTGVDDADANNETVTISHSITGGGYGSVSVDNVSVTVTDDDTAGVTVTPTTLTVGEGSTSSYTIVLDTQPTGNVTITPSSDDTDAATVSDALTFTQANWNTAQSVMVTGVDDADTNNETVTISHSITGGGYGSVSVDNVSVTVTDDDTAGVTVTPTTLTVGEGSTSSYTIVLDTQPTGNVTITPSSGDAAAATVSGALTFTQANWNTAQPVTVTGVADTNNETVTISHSITGGGYGSVSVDNVSVVIFPPGKMTKPRNVEATAAADGNSITLTWDWSAAVTPPPHCPIENALGGFQIDYKADGQAYVNPRTITADNPNNEKAGNFFVPYNDRYRDMIDSGNISFTISDDLDSEHTRLGEIFALEKGESYLFRVTVYQGANAYCSRSDPEEITAPVLLPASVGDNTAPTLSSITRESPTDATTSQDTLTWKVTFSEDVQNVTANDFTISGTTAMLSVTKIADNEYDVTADGGDLDNLDGIVTLGFNSNQDIEDLAGNDLRTPTDLTDTENTFTVSNTVLTGSSGNSNSNPQPQSPTPLTARVTPPTLSSIRDLHTKVATPAGRVTLQPDCESGNSCSRFLLPLPPFAR